MRKLLSGVVAIALTTSLASGNVEAKKKNHKPTLSFKGKLKNKKKMTVNVGDKVYVKGKAKDKEDGNITRKIKVKVTKPENGSYKKKGNYVTFFNDGIYKVTLSVKDKKKKKAKKSRYIVVKDVNNTTTNEYVPVPEEGVVPLNDYLNNEDSIVPTSSTTPSTQTPSNTSVTTPTPSNTSVTTPTPSNTSVITPTPTSTPSNTEFNPDVVKFNAVKKTFGGNTYNVTTQKITNSNFINTSTICKPGFIMENDYGRITVEKDSNYFSTDEYLRFFGNVRAVDYTGKDITSNLIISTNGKFDENGNIKTTLKEEFPIYFYIEDQNGNSATKKFFIRSTEYTAIERINRIAAPQNYVGIVETSPYIVSAQLRELVDSLKNASKTLTLDKDE